MANLFGEERRALSLEEWIGDVVALLDPNSRLDHSVRLELRPGLTAVCHPEQIAAVVSAILHHLFQMQHQSRDIVIRTSAGGATVRIEILAPALVRFCLPIGETCASRADGTRGQYSV